MVSLADTCCLDITFDTNNNTIIYNDNVSPVTTKRIELKNLLPALLNKSLHYPEVVYEEHIQVFHNNDREISSRGMYFDLITLPQGLLGVEFIKSHIYYSPVNKNDKLCTIIEVHLGVLTVIMQKNKPRDEYDIHTSVEEGLVIKLRKGEKLAVPQGYFYTFINTEEEPAVFVRMHKGNDVVDYSLLKRERGLAYYCIRKNAREEIVQNPIYRDVPKIKELAANSFLKDFGIDVEASLYEQLKAETERFFELLV